ncbi:conserved protein of unknown function [Bradyrhizobium vignae]|uniref:Uncharacterized protein n=1 Tax=Bradyrhizobium vignae TaxID=1549949 RepID=A0A2U3Q9Z7_9BRAD|nr:conserved protein of unknown function [Bradyrhizobium vignae]
MRHPDAFEPRGYNQGGAAGLAAVKFWTRKKLKETAALKKKINPTPFPRRTSRGRL